MDLIAALWPLLLPISGIIIALIHIRWRKIAGWQAIGTVLMWQLAVGLGLGYVWAGFGHLFAADQVAASIGWAAGSPFQREVGMWDLSLGIVGVLALLFRNEGYYAATIIATGLFSISAGLGHVYELVVHGNTAVNNAGAVMYLDLFYPLFLAGLLVMYHIRKKEEIGAITASPEVSGREQTT
jgi:hypothetical protein